MAESMAVEQPKFLVFTKLVLGGQAGEYYGQQLFEQLRPQLSDISLELILSPSDIPAPFTKFFGRERNFPTLLQLLPSGFGKTDLQLQDLRVYGQTVRECRGDDQLAPLHYHMTITPEYLSGSPEQILAWVRAGL